MFVCVFDSKECEFGSAKNEEIGEKIADEQKLYSMLALCNSFHSNMLMFDMLMHFVEVKLLDIMPDKVVKYEDTYSMTLDLVLQVVEYEAVAQIIQEQYITTVAGN